MLTYRRCLRVFTRPTLFVSSAQLSTLATRYDALVTENKLIYDEKQYKLLNLLDKLEAALADYKGIPPPSPLPSPPPSPAQPPSATTPPSSTSHDTSPLNSSTPNSHPTPTPTPTPPISPPIRRIKGVYVYGEVGCGKTLAMDMFFNHSKVTKKRRVHFHKFMLDVHKRIHQRKQELLHKFGRDVNINLSSERDAITYVAHGLADEALLLCFDEFQVTDIVDALILSKLFGILWSRGTVLVATSNRPPQDLYKDGLNREYFLPFIKQLEKECIVRSIGAGMDYRQLSVGQFSHSSYLTPVNERTTQKLQKMFEEEVFWGQSSATTTTTTTTNETMEDTSIDSIDAKIINDKIEKDEKIPVMMGRWLPVKMSRTCEYDVTLPFEPQSKILNAKSGNDEEGGEREEGEREEGEREEGEKKDVEGKHVVVTIRSALVDFVSICEGDRGAADYQALCSHFDVIYLTGIPQMSVLAHDKARRFITLVDEMYDAGVLCRWTAAEAPGRLFRSLDAQELHDESLLAKEGRFGVDHSWSRGDNQLDKPIHKVVVTQGNKESSSEGQEVGGGNGKEDEKLKKQIGEKDASILSTSRMSQSTSCVIPAYTQTFHVPPPTTSTSTSATSTTSTPSQTPLSASASTTSTTSTMQADAHLQSQGVVTLSLIDKDKETGKGTGTETEKGKGKEKASGIDAAQEELKILEGELASVQELRFAFKRAASRLTEMAGAAYMFNWSSNKVMSANQV